MDRFIHSFIKTYTKTKKNTIPMGTPGNFHYVLAFVLQNKKEGLKVQHIC